MDTIGILTKTLAGMGKGPLWLQKQVLLHLLSIISFGIVMVWGVLFFVVQTVRENRIWIFYRR